MCWVWDLGDCLHHLFFFRAPQIAGRVYVGWWWRPSAIKMSSMEKGGWSFNDESGVDCWRGRRVSTGSRRWREKGSLMGKFGRGWVSAACRSPVDVSSILQGPKTDPLLFPAQQCKPEPVMLISQGLSGVGLSSSKLLNSGMRLRTILRTNQSRFTPLPPQRPGKVLVRGRVVY